MECIQCKSIILKPKKLYCSNKCKAKHSLLRDKRNNNNCSYTQLKGYLKRKLEAINFLGGACNKCGYKENLSALHFHHKNPEEKLFNLDARAFANRSKDLILNEINKCEILCANCHAETHYPDNKISNIISFTLIKGKSLVEVKTKPTCIDCGKLTNCSSSGLCWQCLAVSKRKFKRPLPEELILDLMEFKNSSRISKKYNCSHKAIEKWFVYYGLNYKKLRQQLQDHTL